MTPRATKLLLVLAALLPMLFASCTSNAQYVLQCDAIHVRTVPDSIFRSNFQ